LEKTLQERTYCDFPIFILNSSLAIGNVAKKVTSVDLALNQIITWNTIFELTEIHSFVFFDYCTVAVQFSVLKGPCRDITI
jgi:hypothetical protein